MARFDLTIAGEINLDLILYGLPAQMDLDRELMGTDFALTLGSSSAILAHNASVLGLKVGFVTKLGHDALGPICLKLLEEGNVDVSRAAYTTTGTPTGITIQLDHNGSRHTLSYAGAMNEMVYEDLDIGYLRDSRHFHLSSLFLHKALQKDLPGMFRDFKKAGLSTSLDTNDDPEDRWDGVLDELLGIVDIFLPNEGEAMRITGRGSAEEALAALAQRVPIVAMKCGGRGSLVSYRGTTAAIPPITVIPVDTVGAGDSFNAGFLKGYLDGKSPEDCAAMGNATAALSTLRRGGIEAFRDRQFMKEFLKSKAGALVK